MDHAAAWEREVRWLLEGSHTGHSHLPQDPPEGFIRLGYAVKYGPEAGGPSYLYIRPEWVQRLRPAHRGEPAWVLWCDNKRSGSDYASIDEESYRLLRAMRNGRGYVDAHQPPLFGGAA